MSLSIVKINASAGQHFVTATQRLCRTEDGRLVLEGDPAGRWLFCVPGQEISLAEAKQYGLIAEPKPLQADAAATRSHDKGIDADRPAAPPEPDSTDLKDQQPKEKKVRQPKEKKAQ